MFDKFGNFNSCEELNMAAEGLLKEGDYDSLRALAEENGLGENAHFYIDGMIPQLVDHTGAAIGKLEVESKELEVKELMVDWVDYIKELCFESEEFARAVRRSDKELAGCLGSLLVYSFKNMITVKDSIMKAAKKEAHINAGNVKFGIPGMGTAKALIRKYYGGNA